MVERVRWQFKDCCGGSQISLRVELHGMNDSVGGEMVADYVWCLSGNACWIIRLR